ncbi:MAG: hypothetical protein NTX14_02500 [Candidatus Nealsonbacteria bacterium]|nr:hypothetical protein [Candidatus Nealsonbacteria bacterium]
MIKNFIKEPEKTLDETFRTTDPNVRWGFILLDFKNELEFWQLVDVSEEEVYEAVMSL